MGLILYYYYNKNSDGASVSPFDFKNEERYVN